MPEPGRYSFIQRALHWTTVIAVVGLVPMGFYMVWRYHATDNDPITVQLFDAHKLVGFLLLWLVVLRIAVRVWQGVPVPAPTLTPVQRVASAGVHAMLYGLLLVVPVLGWAGASAYDLRSLPGGVLLPRILATDTDLAGLILYWHGWGAIALACLAAAHVAAALFHRFVLRDGVFERMWASRSGRK